MKALAIVAVIGVLAAGGGCACTTCPCEDVIYLVQSPYGGTVPVKMKKGFFDEPENYRTMEQWEEMMQEEADPSTGSGQADDGGKDI